MQHLHTERLAALADGQPTQEEAAHLVACETCAHERGAYRALIEMAQAERESFGLPLTRWDAIANELAQEAVPLLRSPARRSNRGMLQIAASVLLVAGGVVAGRVSAGERPLPTGDVAATAKSGAPAAPTADSQSFASIEEARAAQQRSETLYLQAATFLARYDSTGAVAGSPVAYRSKLSALDQVLSTTRQAMREAPHDPVINDYYLTTLGQREATLRQLNTALPASLRLSSF
jgi:hypothetical protein